MLMQKSFTAPPGALASAVRYVARWLVAKPIVPTQGGIRFTVADGSLTLTGFNEYTTAHATLKVEGPASGSFVVAGRLIAALVDTFPDKAVTFEQDADNGHVAVSAGRWRGTLPSMPVDDFPPLHAEAPVAGLISGAVLADAIRRVGVAAARGDERPAMQCMQFIFTDDTVTLMSTDTLRVARVVAPWSSADTYEYAEGNRALVYAATMLDAVDGFDGLEPVRIGADAGSLSLATATRTLITRQIGEPFPDLAAFFNPLPGAVVATVTARDVVAPLKRAQIVQGKRETPPTAQLDFTAGLVTLSTENDQSGSGDEEIDIEYDGPDMTVVLRSGLLHAALSTVPGGIVRMAIVPGVPVTTKPLLITSPSDPTWAYVTMPVRKLGANA